MGIYLKIKKGINILKQSKLKKVVFKVSGIYRLHGLKGLQKAIQNKLAGLPFQPENDKIDFNLEAEEFFCNGILRKQQEEFPASYYVNEMQDFVHNPLISIIMPIYNPPLKWLNIAIRSVEEQYYTNWQLCIVDDGSTDVQGIRFIEQKIQAGCKISFYKSSKNQGISRASNKALEMAQGDYVALLDQDDELPPDALFWFVKEINKEPKADFLYSDECKISESDKERFFDFLFKPEWSACLMINNMFVGHFVMYKTALLKKIGGFNPEFDCGQDYDLAVRMGDSAGCIRHIPRILYYWRALPTSTATGGKPFSNKINMAVPFQWLKSKGILSNIHKNMHYNYPVIIQNTGKISVIFLSVSLEKTIQAVETILQETSYRNYELILSVTREERISLEQQFPFVASLRYVEYEEHALEIAKRFNRAANVASGHVMVFLYGILAPLCRNWLETLLDGLVLPAIGAVSPVILNQDEKIHYAGGYASFSSCNYLTKSPFQGQSFYSNFYHYLINPWVLKECLALSKMCIAVKKNVFFEVGKFDEKFTPRCYWHESFSFALQEKGYNCLYNPECQLMGDYSVDLIRPVDGEMVYALKCWARYYSSERYFSDLMKAQFTRSLEMNFKVYAQRGINYLERKKKNILVFAHELTRTGAPVVILDAVKELVGMGNFVVVISPFDGPLRMEFIESGAILIIDNKAMWGRGEKEKISFFKDEWYMDAFIKGFDCIIIGTLMGHNLINRYQHAGIPILWWIHEGRYTLEFVDQYLPKLLSSNVKVFCVGKYAQRLLREYGFLYPSNLLLYGVQDVRHLKKMKKSIKTGKVKFVVVGTIDERKGQDIVLDAINFLPEDIRNQAEFIFVGIQSFGNVYDKLLKAVQCYDNIILMDAMNRDEVYNLYQEVDCLICPSRDDPMPVVATETMMFSNICICSTHTGTADFIEDGYNGFVFENENAEALSQKLTYVVSHRNSLDDLKRRGRVIYEQHFSMQAFAQKLQTIISEITND